MRILCPGGHGYQIPIQLSPDYKLEDTNAFRAQCLRVRFIHNSQPVDEYWFSRRFVAQENVEVGDQALPDDYPSWVEKTITVCRRCFEERG
jgi:hypothetical protein